MSWSRAFYWVDALGKNIFSARGANAFLSAFGVLWFMVEASAFFSEDFGKLLKANAWAFAVAGFVYSVWLCRPFLKTECKLTGRDVGIEVRIGDVFKEEKAAERVLIIGTNTTFDTKLGAPLIAERSVQGQFTKRYFPNEETLDLSIGKALEGIAGEQLDGPRAGKSVLYPMGTTIEVKAAGGVRSFWVAMADLNEHGTAITNLSNLELALSELWVHMGERGTCDTVVMPAIGSRFGQMTISREASVRLIIQSFLAACAERTFCEKLVIVLSGTDVVRHKIDLREIGTFVQHACRYSSPPVGGAPVGTPVG
ncbi:macro domain-containing protein [uncultured Phenylobacterium sp.]|uniref:macro domain-containing protein n=1 Tax=uncultured Phenylobacterium sp. TaxID=349273 RepID=UPI0025CD5830|nr:macro domain-containing protein [uncultured Phenylobacterium sp.]